MDYFKRTQSSFSINKLFSVSEYQQAFQTALLKTPLIVAQLRCAESEARLQDCADRLSRDHPDCEEFAFEATLCLCSALAPNEFSVWESCARKNEADPSRCEAQMVTMLEKTQEVAASQQEWLERPSRDELPLVRQIERTCTSVGEEEKLACSAAVVCDADYSKFLECTAKNGDDYDAPACRAAGRKLAQCIGERAVVVLMKQETKAEMDRQNRG